MREPNSHPHPAFFGIAGLLLVLGMAWVNHHQKPGEPPQSRSLAPVVAHGIGKPASLHRPVLPDCHPKKQKCVYLTFDDGPWELTGRIVKVLARLKVRATFFVVGANLSAYPAQARALRHSQQAVGLHTWAHGNLQAMSAEAIRDDLTRTRLAVRRVLHRKAACYRPPYGASDERVRRATRQLGLVERMWSVDPQDWNYKNRKQIVASVMTQVKPNGVILLHDGGGNRWETLHALPRLIKELRRRGYGFRYLC